MVLRPCLQPSSTSAKSSGRRGFSLLEMLVVVVLIGILGGIAIGAFSSTSRDMVTKVTNQRNAQEIVSMGVYATMGGAQFVVPGDKSATVQNLIDGTLGKAGGWKGKTFRLAMSPEAKAGALAYLKFESSLLLYDPTGRQP